jgi:hypothetical protein
MDDHPFMMGLGGGMSAWVNTGFTCRFVNKPRLITYCTTVRWSLGTW